MADKLNILMVAYPFPPYQWAGGASIRLVKFLKYMVAMRPQWNFNVVTAGYGRRESAMKPLTADLLAELPKCVRVHRIDDPALLNWPTAGLINRAAAKLLRPFNPALADKLNPPLPELPEAVPDKYTGWNEAVLNWARQSGERYDIIYASCPPYSTAVLGGQLKDIFNCPLIVDIKDNWITAREKLPPPHRAIEEKLERDVVAAADAIICVTAKAFEAYGEYYNAAGESADIKAKLHLITNGVDLADFESVFGDKGAPRDKFSITYTGSLGGDNRSPEKFFRAFRTLLDCESVRREECLVSFPAAMPEKFWAIAEQLGLEKNILKAQLVDRDEYTLLLNRSQVLLSINYYNETTLVPGKLYEYWAAGRPVLLIEKPGAATALVKRYDLGLCADSDDEAAIFDCLWELWRQYDAGENFTPRSAGLAQFSREALADQLCEIFEQLLPGKDALDNESEIKNV